MHTIAMPNWFKVARWFVAGAFVFFGVLATHASADGPTIMRVEEDWELVVSTPSPTSDAPQVTCMISPLGNMSGLHATFALNHHATPTFTAGGLQLQTWNGATLLDSKRAPNQALLATPNETIRWTQVMQKNEGVLVFEVVNGTSTTWGTFGGDGTLKISLVSSLANLNGYDPQVSAKNSGVSYAANRVASLVLKRVRVFTSDGVMTEDTTPRVVHTLSQ